MCVCVDDSAKVAEFHEVTPQSNYVTVQDDGVCLWHPRYELSASQCPVDVKWFPFDTQTCQLDFESWMLLAGTLQLLDSGGSDNLHSFRQPDAWTLTGNLPTTSSCTPPKNKTNTHTFI